VAAANGYAYVASSTGLIVVDVANPALPVQVGSCSLPGSSAQAVAISGGHAYVAAFAAGLRIVDISNPIAPIEIGFCDTPGYAMGVAFSGSSVYIADDFAGLCIVDVSNPSSPITVGFYNTPGEAHGITVSGAYAYVADYYYFGIYDVSAALPVNPWETAPSHPSSFVLHPPHPNPFNPTTVLSFDLPVAGLVKLEVFDINGRPIMSGSGTTPTTETWFSAGTHQIPFDGSGLPSGIYLARLTAGDWSAAQKLVLMK
jgi:uncharacterized secreted protein with C-terminal beta-propeller domain